MSEPALKRLPAAWFSPADLAALHLPALPNSDRGIRDQIERENWRVPAFEGVTWRKRNQRGGGFEYHVSLLPIEAQAAAAMRLQEAERGAKSVPELVFASADAIRGDLLAIAAAQLRISQRLERIEEWLRELHQ